MDSPDWNTAPTEWQQGKRQEPNFRQDLGGFLFHVSMVVLIGASIAGIWQIFSPQLEIRITTEQSRI